MPRLHVNVDHVATVRQARRGTEPDPVAWALAAEDAGAHGITCHLRGDRRHIQETDVRELRKRVRTLLNLETSLDEERIRFALDSGADAVCIVPERREELTTEGGLDARAERERLERALPRFAERGIVASLFLDPDPRQIVAAVELGAPFVELHTGAYARASGRERELELERLVRAAALGRERGLRVNAGHGLSAENVAAVARIAGVEELNIGFALVTRALFAGVGPAVREMLEQMGEGP